MRVLVTGGAGFIGSHVVDAWTAGGSFVLALDDLSSGSLRNLDESMQRGGQFAECDIRDRQAVHYVMRHFQPEVVVHLAAQVAIASSTADPAHDAEINIVGTINVITGAALAAARRVIYISSGGAIYGQATTLPTPESTTPKPQSAYGLSKLAGERYVELVGLASSMNFTSLRLGNVYGPRQSPLTGGVVARFCDLLISGKRLQVVGDGRQSRDFIYVDDVVSAVTAAAWLEDPAGRAFNISSGRATSILDLAHILSSLSAQTPAIELRGRLAADAVQNSHLDTTRAVQFGLLNDVTPLAVGLQRTLEWHQALIHQD